MIYELLGQPCRNFQFLAIERIVDPKDKKEKVVLSNCAAGAVGNLVIVDPVTGEGESLPFPGDEGAWGLLNLNNEKLIVGTCTGHGYLHCFDLKTRTWAEPLRDPKEKYIWSLCRGSDGMVYGGTYPGGVLLRYDPARHALENLGRVSDDPTNLYTRQVYGGIPGYILVACMMKSIHLSLWNIATGQWRRFGKPGAKVREITAEFICLETDGVLDFYDPHTFEPLPADLSAKLTPVEPPPFHGMGLSVVKLNDDSTVGIRGQQFVRVRSRGAAPELKPIPATRPPTSIHTLATDENGKIWGASGFGQTIFSYDPTTGAVWNSEMVCDYNGEVYGLVCVRGRLFMSAYSHGDHVVYDPSQPWDQIHNLNPRTLQTVHPELIRPTGRSVIGPDGHVWTGWSAKYGVYGGGLSRVTVDTLQVSSWYDPIPNQAINGLVADERYLHFTTDGKASGLPNAQVPFHFVVWSPSGNIVRDMTFHLGEIPCVMAAVAGRVLIGIQDRAELRVFNTETMEYENPIPLSGIPSTAVTWGTDRAVVFAHDMLLWVNPVTRQTAIIGKVPAGVSATVITPGGDLFFSKGIDLFRVQL